MKQLSIKEKAKRYDEAIKKFKPIYDLAKKQGRNIDVEEFENVFPELKESEDEKIRKELIDFVKSRLAGFPQCEKFIAWLEKQGEQKPVWSEEDEEMFDSIIVDVSYIGDFPDYPTKEENELYDECLAKVEWLKSLKERYTWEPSDEQIKVCKEVYADLLSAKGFGFGTINSELNRLEEQLKKLK